MTDLYFPYQLKRCMSVLPIRKPAQEEFDACHVIWLTLFEEAWEPSNIYWEEQDTQYTNNDVPSTKHNVPLDKVNKCMGITNGQTSSNKLEATSQLDTISMIQPQRQHLNSKHSMLGVKRIDDTVFTYYHC